MKVFINKNIPEAGILLLQEKGFDLTINPTENVLSRSEFIQICQQNDALLNVGANNLDEDFFEQCPNIKGIALFSVGFDSLIFHRQIVVKSLLEIRPMF
jgi:glyoxylate reductase